MIDPFSKTKFHPDLRLETWYPTGVLDFALAAQMVNHVGFDERILDEPFNRFADLSGITEIHLKFKELYDLAAERRETYALCPPVKSAFLATTAAAFGIARMFAMLMEKTPIDVQVFRDIDSAAEWLGVPAQSLREES
jgi:hypothetical protein